MSRDGYPPLSVGVLGAASLSLMLIGSIGVANAAPEERVLAAWKQRQDQWESVRFQFSGSATTAAGYSSGPRYADTTAPIDRYPSESRTTECSGSLLLDYQHGRVRIEETGETLASTPDAPPFPVPKYEILVFDGNRYQAYRPKDANFSPEMVRREMRMTQLYNSSELRRPAFPMQHIPLLLACGEITAARMRSISAIGHAPTEDDLQVEGSVELQGVPCTILRSLPNERGRHFEYWVKSDDPRQILRYEVHGVPGTGGVWLSVSIEYETIDGDPIPQKWEVTEYSFQTGKPRTYMCRLESFEINLALDDSEFLIEEKPGMIVHDSSRPKEDRRYVASVAGEPEVPYLEFIRREQAARDSAQQWWIYGLLAMGILLLFAAFLRRRKQLA